VNGILERAETAGVFGIGGCVAESLGERLLEKITDFGVS
jgi:hypothetical protein